MANKKQEKELTVDEKLENMRLVINQHGKALEDVCARLNHFIVKEMLEENTGHVCTVSFEQGDME